MNFTAAILISLLVGVIISGLIYTRKDKAHTSAWKYVTTALRGLVAALLTFLILAPRLNYTTHEKKKPIILWLQDNSASIPLGLKDDTTAYTSTQKEAINALENSHIVDVYQFGGHLKKSNESDYSEQVTQIDVALQNALNRYQNDNLGAIVLASDGIYNRGSDPLYSIANSKNIPIYTVAIGDSSSPRDISIPRVYANKVVTVGNAFEIAFDARFSHMKGSTHTIQLIQNGQIVGQKTQNITQDQEVVSGSFELTAQKAGIHHFKVSIPVAEGEASDVNNTFDLWIEFISSDVKVLVLSQGVHPDLGYIGQALGQAKGFDYTIAPPQTLPEDFLKYDIFILHQPLLNSQQWKRLADAQKPMWHILGSLTHPLHMEMVRQHFKVMTGQSISQFQNISLIPQFPLFRLPLSAQDVLKRLPPLESRIPSVKALSSTDVLLKAQQSDIWMISSTAPVAVTNGEGLWKWGMYEHKNFASQQITHELIQQTIYSLKKPQVDKVLHAYLNKPVVTDQEHVAISAEVRNANGQLVNSPDVLLKIEGDNGYQERHSMERIGNSYHLLLPQLASGEYHFTAETSLDGQTHMDKGQFVVENIPLEHMNVQANYPLLYQLATEHGGRMYAWTDWSKMVKDLEAREDISTLIHSDTRQHDWTDFTWMFILIMSLLTAEWLLRKYHALQ